MTTTITRTPRSRLTLRTNLVRNPKVAANATDWTAVTQAGTIVGARVASAAPTGSFLDTWYRATLGTAASAYMDARISGAGVNPVTAGATYTASAYLRPTSAGASTGQIYIQWIDLAGAILSTSASDTTPLTADFVRVNFTATAPAGAVRAVLIFRANAASTFAIGNRLDVGGAMLQASTVLTGYFDGDTASVGTSNYAWTGAANASTSIEVRDNPADIFTPFMMLGYEMSRRSSNNVIDVPGSSSSVVVLHPAKKRAGKLSLALADEAEAIALDALLSQTAAFILADTDRGIAGMTFALDPGGLTISLDPQTRRRFLADAQIVEL